MIRLDKFLADREIGTRQEVKKLIKAGQVSINGIVVKDNSLKFEESNSIVTCQGKTLSSEKYVYFLFHKPAGCVTAERDDRYPVVMDYFRGENCRGLSPVGRLDLDTEGLLLITNDGQLNHRLMSPAHHVAKTYLAHMDGILPTDTAERFAAGIDIGDGKPTLPAELKVLTRDEAANCSVAELTITEGRFHQVKRMFAAVGCEVIRLERLTLGPLTLGDLPAGNYRRLTAEEVHSLYTASDK